MSATAERIEAARRRYVAAIGTASEAALRRVLEHEVDAARQAHRKDARRDRRCEQCAREASIAKRADGTGLRALLWCFACRAPACGGDSFVVVSDLDSLPDANPIGDPQGALF